MKRNNVGKMITLIPLYCFFKAKHYTVIGESGIFQENARGRMKGYMYYGYSELFCAHSDTKRCCLIFIITCLNGIEWW